MKRESYISMKIDNYLPDNNGIIRLWLHKIISYFSNAQ